MNNISIIVPIYNIELFLDSCLKSLANQTFSDLEIILVDDGSTDGSGAICDEYAIKDNRFRVIHKANGGLSSARNAGIEAANGRYITFIDSDDYIAPDYIELLYTTLIKHKADISVCDYMKVPERKEFEALNYSISEAPNNDIVLTSKEAIKNVYSSTYHGVDFISVAKLYEKALFVANGIMFPEGKIHEDAFTTYKLMYSADKVAYVDKSMYFYRIREGSITTSSFSMKRFDKIQATREECQFFCEKKEYDLLEVSFFDHIHEVKTLLNQYIKSDCFDGSRFDNEVLLLRKDIERYSKNINWPLKKAILYGLLVRFPGLIKIL